jgi:hypothetical protein
MMQIMTVYIYHHQRGNKIKGDELCILLYYDISHG